MRRRVFRTYLARMLSISIIASLMLSGCSGTGVSNTIESTDSSEEIVSSDDEEAEPNTNDLDTNEDNSNEYAEVLRKSFLAQDEILYNPNLVPCAEGYELAEDFSNVINFDDYTYLNDETFDRLAQNGFVVDSTWGDNEFYDEYEYNRYALLPNFITVDSLMHTYHLYFGYLLKNTEKKYLIEKVENITEKMLGEAINQHDKLLGTEWEDAAVINVSYFAIAANLIGLDVEIPDYAKEIVEYELDNINAAEGIDVSPISQLYEDYTQYIPRGYYEGDEQLEKYFKTMMWYGRISFANDKEISNRVALLMSNALENTCLEDWESVYMITSFFAGAADDCGFYEYNKAINSSYGLIGDIKELIGDSDKFDAYTSIISKMNPPRINSVPVWETEDNVVISFRFMGQRFSVDETIFTNLTYRNVLENAEGDKRYLPDTLDVAAVLGSEAAMELLEESGATGYKNYSENVDKLKEEFNVASDETWNASLYSNWINTLRPLLTQKGEGAPLYQQNPLWTLKNLETFAGSFAELKHDTILYSKQNMAEMGGGDIEEKDDRGYVDPEPIVYSRFANLANKTKLGLEQFGLLGKEEKECLELLYDMATTLITISEKELVNETLSEEEYEFIRCYGGNLEHFWIEVNKDMGYELCYSDQSPCPIIADISTDPNGNVLEVGSGEAQTVYVLVVVDGKLKIASGTVYSFYQFSVPLNERMTDSEWRKRLSGYLDENYDYHEPDPSITQPEWTQGYRVDRSID